MRRPSIAFLVCLLAWWCLHGTAAAGGGWWSGIGLDDQHIGAGESFTHRLSEVWFPSMRAARAAAATDQYVYLIEDFDRGLLKEAYSRRTPRGWWEPPAEAVRAGKVRLFNWNGNIAQAEVHFDVPDLSSDVYHVMLCDAGCRKPLGDVIPDVVHLTAEPLVARKLRALEDRIRRLRASVQSSQWDLWRMDRRADRLSSSADLATARLDELDQSSSAIDTRRPAAPWLAYAGWFLAGAAAVAVSARRRRSRAGEMTGYPAEAVPDDARELVSSSSG